MYQKSEHWNILKLILDMSAGTGEQSFVLRSRWYFSRQALNPTTHLLDVDMVIAATVHVNFSVSGTHEAYNPR